METSNILFFDKCRLCLLHKASFNIFDVSDDLPQAIHNCTGVKVKKSDGLPQKICSKCMEIVEQARDLRKLAMKNDSHLKSLFGEKEDKLDENSEDEDTDTETLINDNSTEKDGKSNGSSDKRNNDKERSTKKSSHSEKPKKESEKSIKKDFSESSSAVSSSTKGKDEKRIRHKMIKKDGCEEFVCGVCDKHFKTYKKVYLHGRSHDKKILCPLDVCGKKFTTKGDLNKHMRTHTGVKPYSCDLCDKKFTQQGTLKAHRENIHYIYT